MGYIVQYFETYFIHWVVAFSTKKRGREVKISHTPGLKTCIRISDGEPDTLVRSENGDEK